MALLEASGIGKNFGDTKVLKDISLTLEQGEALAIIGSSGSGKTTLLRAMTRTLPCRSGNILLDDRSIASYGRKEFARTAAFMPQSRPVPGITVRALVAHGRFPYLGFSRRMTAQDTAAVEQAMRRTGTLDWANRDVRALSGGERQRMLLAQVLCQEPDVLLLDEPGNHLDLRFQQELFLLIDAWRREPGHAVVSVVHDLSLARKFGTHALLLSSGRGTYGEISAILTPAALESAWQMDVVGWLRSLGDVWQE